VLSNQYRSSTPETATALVQLGSDATSEVDQHPVHRLLPRDVRSLASATSAPVVPVASHPSRPWVVNSLLILYAQHIPQTVIHY